MSIGIVDIFDQVVSHAAKTGYFESVNSHEAKSAPGNGLHCEVWIDRLQPYPTSSGLAATTAVLVLNVRVMVSMLAEPQDDIDQTMMTAVDTLLGEYSGDFELGGKVRNIDLLGASGFALSAKGGYLEIDKKIFRVLDISLPMIIDDIWEQSP